MKRRRIYRLAVFLLLSIAKVQAQQLELIKTTRLTNYPSASTLEFYKDRLYVIGDDASKMLVLDRDHAILDSIALFGSGEQRIPKSRKADIESTTMVAEGGREFLMALSSFSTQRRNKLILIDVTKKQKQQKGITLPTIRGLNNREINIEGMALVGTRLVLANRPNTSQKINYLIAASFNLTKNIRRKDIVPIPVQFPATKTVVGFSGLSYVKSSDALLFTASSENTSSTYTDGEIGESYLGVIDHISEKLGSGQVRVDMLIPLSLILGRRPQKIESIAVESEKGADLVIHLASDNDNGESTLFKLRWLNYLHQ